MIKIIEAGIASTVQDNGRFGYKAFGVPQSGAFDGHAHNCANILIGNSDNCATLEIIAGGLHIQFNSWRRNALLTQWRSSGQLVGIPDCRR